MTYHTQNRRKAVRDRLEIDRVVQEVARLLECRELAERSGDEAFDEALSFEAAARRIVELVYQGLEAPPVERAG